MNDDNLREVFEEFGEVSSAKVITDKFNGRSKGFGFVEMPNENEGQEAINSLNDSEVMGKKLMVNVARPRTESNNRSRGGERRNFNNRRY